MYIKYSDVLYDSVVDDDGLNLLTKSEEKANKSFNKTTEIYYKIIEETDPNIQDIYDVKFYIKWDSKLKNVITKWRIHSWDYFSEGSVNLCHEGHLPGWTIVEKGLSETCIDAEQIEGYSVEYKYIVKDGKKLDEPLIEEREVTRQEFEEIMETYDNI